MVLCSFRMERRGGSRDPSPEVLTEALRREPRRAHVRATARANCLSIYSYSCVNFVQEAILFPSYNQFVFSRKCFKRTPLSLPWQQFEWDRFAPKDTCKTRGGPNLRIDFSLVISKSFSLTQHGRFKGAFPFLHILVPHLYSITAFARLFQYSCFKSLSRERITAYLPQWPGTRLAPECVALKRMHLSTMYLSLSGQSPRQRGSLRHCLYRIQESKKACSLYICTTSSLSIYFLMGMCMFV